MLKIAICDDEKEFCDSAERMLKLYMEEKGVSFQADTFGVPSDLADMTEKGTIYDIYLLDIYMPGVTGISIATELRNRDSVSKQYKVVCTLELQENTHGKSINLAKSLID